MQVCCDVEDTTALRQGRWWEAARQFIIKCCSDHCVAQAGNLPRCAPTVCRTFAVPSRPCALITPRPQTWRKQPNKGHPVEGLPVSQAAQRLNHGLSPQQTTAPSQSVMRATAITASTLPTAAPRSKQKCSSLKSGGMQAPVWFSRVLAHTRCPMLLPCKVPWHPQDSDHPPLPSSQKLLQPSLPP